MTEVWTKWEGQTINGVFPLRRFLSASDHSAVFLTEYKAQNLPNAALKLVPAIPALAQAQLSQWTSATTLAHPHLIRLFEAGRCQFGGHEFLFAVMEYAEQTLSQILTQRALTTGEVREMLPPILSALDFLHSKNLVHGRLKPTNILALDDQLKLASDTVRAAGGSAATIARSSVYDPPEAKFFAAGDIWGLGVTMVEALTQQLPSWPDSTSETASFPAELPPTFVAIVRQCLNRNPADRPTVDEVAAALVSAPQPLVSAPQPLVSIRKPRVREVSDQATPLEDSPRHRSFLRAIAVLCIVVVAAWVGLHVLGSRTSSHQDAPPAAASQNPETSLSAPAVDSKSAPTRLVSRPSEQPAQPLANRLPSVLHEEIPDVPRRNRDTIRGHIKVSVRVTVDSSGNVVDETLENPGPSKYFARLATDAAGKWKFAPAANHDSRKWLLRFEFTRGGATGHATTPR